MRLFLPVLLAVLGSPLHALCSGPDIRPLLSDADRAAVAEAVARTPFAQGILYEAEKDDTHLTIIGTMHLYDPRLAPLAERTAPIIAASDLLLVEAGRQEQAALTSAMSTDPTLLFLPDGPTLPERLDEDTWQAVAQAVGDRGVPAVLASKMQPWYIGLMLAIPSCAMSDLQIGLEGLDGIVMDQADAADVPVQALEPWDTLFSLMRSDPIDVQVDQLRLALSPPELQAAMFGTMLDSYFAGDIAELWEVSRAAIHLLPGIDRAEADTLFDLSEQQLLVDRNAAWMPVILNAARTHDRIAIAVGAAHLQGERGILNLLAQDGWEVGPLR